MTTTVSQVSVDAPADAVWDLLAGFADISSWASNVSQSSLLSSGPVGLGSVRRVQVGRAALRETVTAWEPARTLAYDIAGLPPVVTAASNTWTLEPAGTGTAVTLTTEAQTRGGPLIARVVGRKLGQAGDDLTRSLALRLRSTHP